MDKLRIVVPKGRISENVESLLNDSGVGMKSNGRYYIPYVEDKEIAIKIMKPQNIPELVELGSHDAGFTGKDWINETNSDVEIIMDLGFNPVKIIVAIPENINIGDLKRKKNVVVASEYSNISKKYLIENGYDFRLLRTYGATEVFPPDDADMIIDNTSTGLTLKENKLKIIDIVMYSSTVFIANKKTLENPFKRRKIENLKLLFKSILDSKSRVMLEMNVSNDCFEDILNTIPSMKSPTVAPLYKDQGYSIKVAVKKKDAPNLILKLKQMGAGDILEYEIKKVVI